MSSQTQTVLRFTSPRTGVECLEARTEPVPEPGRHEVLVKVRSVGLNYRDVAIATDTYLFPVRENVCPACDMAGEVAALGEGADDGAFRVGDRVTAIVNPTLLYGFLTDPLSPTWGGPVDGMLREYVVIPAIALIKLPESRHSLAEWASIVTTASTVWNAFYGHKALKPGETVLVLGTGGVSLTALVLAKAAGCTTIVTSSSDDKLARARRDYGADHTVNYATHAAWSAEVLHLTGGRGADHVVENGGTGTIAQSLAAAAYGGVVSVVGFLSRPAPGEPLPDVAMAALGKGCVVRGVLGGSKEQFEHAVRFVASRSLPVPLDRTFGFGRDEVVEALRYIQEGKHMGKVVINFPE